MVVEGFCIQRENRLAGVCVDGHVVGPYSNIDYQLPGYKGGVGEAGGTIEVGLMMYQLGKRLKG